MNAETRVWDKEAVQHLIATNDKALARALWLIFQRQTAGERSSHQTVEHNGRGFTGLDAPFLSSVASKLPAYNNNMTPRQIKKVRPMMRKYWRQLLEEIEASGGQVNAKAVKRAKATPPKDDVAPSPKREVFNPLYGQWAM